MIELISSYLIWGLSNFTGQNACANNYQSQHLTTHSTESQTISTNYAGNGLNGPVTGTNVGSAIPRPLLNVNWSHIFRLLFFFLYSISVDSQNITVEWLSDVCCLLFFFFHVFLMLFIFVLCLLFMRASYCVRAPYISQVIPTCVYLLSSIAVHMEIEGTAQCPAQVVLAAALGCEELGIANKLLAQSVFSLWMTSALLEIQLKPYNRPFSVRTSWSKLLQKFSSANALQKKYDEPMIQLRRNVFMSKRDEEKIK